MGVCVYVCVGRVGEGGCGSGVVKFLIVCFSVVYYLFRSKYDNDL